MPGDVYRVALSGAGRLDPAAVLDACPVPVRIISLEGVVEYLNPASVKSSGMVDVDAYRGTPWISHWPDHAQADVLAALDNARRGQASAFRSHRVFADGSRRWLDVQVSPVWHENGEIVRIMAVTHDVTDVVESEAFLDTLVRRLPNPLLVKDARDGRYVLINEAAEEAFGVSGEEWTGKTAFELFPAAEADQFAQEDAEVIASGEMRISEEEAITTRNGVRHFTTKKFATYDGDTPLHLVTLGEDVTDRRNAAIALRAALAEAEQANRAKSEFLANMSHEIRTPLNGIVAGADMLGRADLDPRARELADIIGASAATLERLLSDVLDLARIEAGRITLETTVFQLGDLIRSTAALARLQADEKGLPLHVQIAPEADATFEGDPHRIRQVVVNLLSNAVKFTERGSVTLTAAPSAEGVRVSVADTGIGFKPEMKDRIFGRFQQGDGSITRRFGGTGLGMTISRELVGLMGGTMDAEGAEGAGATFWFDLPLPKAEAPAGAEEGRGSGAPDRPLRILLADDHPTNRKVVQLMLENLAELVCVDNGREALMAYGSGPFDVVLMDMQMPVMDGLAATRRIRESERASGKAATPIIMLTANALPEHVAASLAAGADRHLEKPVTLASLLDAVNEVLVDHEAASDEASAAG